MATVQAGGTRSSASLLLPSLKCPASSSPEEEPEEECEADDGAGKGCTGELRRRSGGVKSSKAWTAESSVLSRRVHQDDDVEVEEEEEEVVDEGEDL